MAQKNDIVAMKNILYGMMRDKSAKKLKISSNNMEFFEKKYHFLKNKRYIKFSYMYGCDTYIMVEGTYKNEKKIIIYRLHMDGKYHLEDHNLD
jgi:hypothetical protein